MLRPLARDLWVIDQPFTLFGARVGVRTTLIRLEDGQLWIHSPVPLSPELADAIEGLGPVAALVAPNQFHHLYIADAARRWPSAAVFAAPGLAAKQPALKDAEVLTDSAPTLWRHQIDQALVGGMPKVNEVVFFHRESKSLIVTDLLFHLRDSDHWWTRTFMNLNGAYGGLKVSKFYRSNIKDAAATRAAADRLLQWDFQRVIMAHGAVLEADARMLVAEALAPIG